MTTWTYTKKVICKHASIENRAAWNNQEWITAYEDWYYDQVDANLADPSIDVSGLETWSVDNLTCEILCADQAQVELLIGFINGWEQKLPALSITIVDHTA